MEIISTSSEQTQKLGEGFSRKIRRGGLVCLFGNLGAGKTTFVQGVARGLNIKQRIVSPTFVVIRQCKKFYHIDLYRVQSLGEIKNLGLEEILVDQENIVFIEWPEKIKEILPKKRTEIYFEYLNETTRSINFL